MLWYGLPMFVVEVTIMSAIMSWLRMASNSVLPSLFVHASHNLFDQMVFQSMSTKESAPYLAGEQGAVTVLITAVIAGIAICFWKQKR